jgi:hypothetical protein
MNSRPWVRYAAAAAFIGIIAAREAFVLAEYPPASTTSWAAFTVGTLVSVGLAVLAVSWSPPTTDIKKHPGWLLLASLSLVIICFGLYVGLDFGIAAKVNLAGENAALRSFALGAAFGAAALFGVGSHLSARKVRQHRLTHADA